MNVELIATYRQMAAQGAQFRGLSILRYAGEIAEVISRHDAQSILDYGSGAGDAYRPPHSIQVQWDLTPTLYDPAFPEHCRKPKGKFDGVVCSDVLEHVDQADAPGLIRDLFDYAERFVWASVCCRPAKKVFPNGRNMHVTIQPFGWWRRRFEKVSALHPGVTWDLVESK